MLRIIALPLMLVTPTYADVFSCVQPDGRTVLQSRPCKSKVVRSLLDGLPRTGQQTWSSPTTRDSTAGLCRRATSS